MIDFDHLDVTRRSDLQLIDRMFRQMWGSELDLADAKSAVVRKIMAVALDPDTPHRTMLMATKVLLTISQLNVDILARQLPLRYEVEGADDATADERRNQLADVLAALRDRIGTSPN